MNTPGPTVPPRHGTRGTSQVTNGRTITVDQAARSALSAHLAHQASTRNCFTARTARFLADYAKQQVNFEGQVLDAVAPGLTPPGGPEAGWPSGKATRARLG